MKFIHGDKGFFREYEKKILPVIIIGAGAGGIFVFEKLASYNIRAVAFCDNYKKISPIKDVDCLSIVDAVVQYNHAYFIVAISNLGNEVVCQQLETFTADIIIFTNLDCVRVKKENLMNVSSKGDTLVLSDIQSQWVNVKRNIRQTCYQPEFFEKTVYILGDSRIFGGECKDKETIASYLQLVLNEKIRNISYNVENLAVFDEPLKSQLNKIERLNLKLGDVIFITVSSPGFDEYSDVYTEEDFNRVCVEYYAELNRYCKKKKAILIVLNTPHVLNMIDPNVYELNLKLSAKSETYLEKNIFRLSEDIIDGLSCNNISICDLNHCVQRPHYIGEKIFSDIFHVNKKANKSIANKMFNMVQWIHLISDNSSFDLQLKNENNQKMQEYLLKRSKWIDFDVWIEKIENILPTQKRGRRGAIVINGNPFTRGHRYLIESASKECEELILFVLQHENAFFSFKERFHMAKLGTEDLSNVTVVEGGEYVISSTTFPEYFQKETVKAEPINAMLDLEIFTDSIAKKLELDIRFVGNEPFCKVTREYNEQMKKYLPLKGIEVREISRLKANEREVSATEVRKLYLGKEFDKIFELVPKTTYEFLMRKAQTER